MSPNQPPPQQRREPAPPAKNAPPLTKLNPTIPPSDPRRGEIWRVDLAPTVGAEMRKERFVVVVNSDRIARLPLRLVAPLTGWDSRRAHVLHLVPVLPEAGTGLTKPSAADTMQLRGLAVERFLMRAGRVSAEVMEEIAAAIAAVVEYE